MTYLFLNINDVVLHVFSYTIANIEGFVDNAPQFI